MKQVAQNYKSGELALVEVPEPHCQSGGVLVQTLYSLISTGTEVMKVKEASLSLVGMARARPEQVRQVVDTVVQQGPAAAYQKVMNRLDSYTPLGYSLCGVVTEVGAGAEEFRVGQLVACAGNEHALHSEVNWVPTNLCVSVPAGVSPQHAAFATVGAIALQGVRQSEAKLGETACVIGLGLVGQLVVQLLVAAGVVVVGIDPVEERCRIAEEAGAIGCAPPGAAGIERIENLLLEASGGIGADYVFLVAGGSTNEPVEAAARLARDRGRIVDIGKCKLDLPWNAYYEKELEVVFSRSYGPGRYDPRYELQGIDYPAGYVRWTERRNLACILDLVARKLLRLESLVSQVFALSEAVTVYEGLQSGELKGVGFLFEYPAAEPKAGSAPASSGAGDTTASGAKAARPGISPPRAARAIGLRKIRIGFIGAGNYASSALLPHLAQNEGVDLRHVATTRSLSALNAQRKFGFSRMSTEIESVLEDDLDAIFVVTRHKSHAALACRVLEAGKAVFVEKPLALSTEQLDSVIETAERTGNDRVMVGFNRRFAPLLVGMKENAGILPGGAVARYGINAGSLSHSSWYADSSEGSRFVGEGGHFIDTVSWWLGARPVDVYAVASKDPAGVVATFRYDDGSVATITYSTNGNSRYPKELFEVSAGGTTARLDNFRQASVYSGRRKKTTRSLGSIDKGQQGELEAFLHALRTGEPMPISLQSLADTTRATLLVEASLASGRPEAL